VRLLLALAPRLPDIVRDLVVVLEVEKLPLSYSGCHRDTLNT
jgi:hypothetical protein